MEWFSGIERGAEATGHGRGGAEVAVDVEELFRAGVVRLHIGVGDGPRRGDAALCWMTPKSSARMRNMAAP
jgi:hypothetical protein